MAAKKCQTKQAEQKAVLRTGKQAMRAGKPRNRIQMPATEKLSAKQKALQARERTFAKARDIYATPNYIAVVDKGGTSYYKKNDENRAIAKKVTGGKLRVGKRTGKTRS